MALLFPSEEWVKEAMEKVNSSPDYAQAAANWEGAITFIVTAIPGQRKEVVLFMDLWHGKCREAYEVTDPAAKKSEFAISAPFLVWRKVLEGKLDPIRGLVSRQLKLKGSMMKVMKAPKAAIELVNSCRQVDTEWPS